MLQTLEVGDVTNTTPEAPRPMRFLIGDTETCGLGENKVCCEVAIREIDPITLKPLKEWQSLIDPQRPIPPEVTLIHGITDEMVADAPTMEEFLETVIGDEFDGCDVTMICHNVPFDISMLTCLATITRTVCTLSWSRLLITDSANHKLQTLREYFGYPEGEAHRAMADVATTQRLLLELLKRANRTLEGFAATEKHNVYVMPWGKQKGQLIATLPVSYLIWLRDLKDLDPNLMDAVKKALAALKKKEGKK